ncbi:sulfatase family protein [Planctomycetes bacterium K23_9]|uniref:Arylsulfatase n=1 Tax=Stieleria marina TaxID=1930275 RepID=A0A517NRQ8_9BACT|nr:Arylsulfatase precursor [Planctomycetes bacterium K23_9]
MPQITSASGAHHCSSRLQAIRSPTAKLIAIACLSICGFGIKSHADDPNRPNVVIVYTDDQGVGDVSALNPTAKFQTPNIDRLAREGMTFTDGHCSDTVCTPSRYGLLTGRYSWRSSLKAGVMGADVEHGLIEDGRMTIASLLRDKGYRTGMFGKWHLGMQFDGKAGQRDWSQPFRDGPIDHGFDEFFGIPASMNYGVLTWLEGDRVTKPAAMWTAKKPGLVTYDKSSYRITPPYGSEPKKSRLGGALEVADDFDDVQALSRFTDRAIQFIEQNSKHPFFAYVPLTSPHKPVIPAPEFVGKTKCGAYGDFMIETDHRLGQILDTLDRLKIADNTIVVFTSDNGAESTYKKRVDVFQHDSSGVLRGGKRDLYEGGHRVPFFIRWPRVVKANSTTDAPVCQSDLLATLAEVVGTDLPADAGEDSESFAAALRGKPFDHGPLVHHGVKGHFAIRDGRWKLILAADGNKLYDLQRDLSETTNVAESHPDLVAQMQAKLTAIVANGRSTAGESQTNVGGVDYRDWCKCCRESR